MPGATRSRRAPRLRPRHPVEILAELVAEDDDAPSDVPSDFYEHLVNHELVLDGGPRFHICTAHPHARATVASGRIPPDFACPNASVGCPLRAIADRAGGQLVRLRARRVDTLLHASSPCSTNPRSKVPPMKPNAPTLAPGSVAIDPRAWRSHQAPVALVRAFVALAAELRDRVYGPASTSFPDELVPAG